MKYIDIVFEEVRSHSDEKSELEFIEVENAQGKSIAVGRWIERIDGYTVLRLFKDVTKSMTEYTGPPPSPPKKYSMQWFQQVVKDMNK